MVGDSSDASRMPSVTASALSARSGGQSVLLRSCDSRPFDMSILLLSSASEGAPSAFRNWSSVMPDGLAYLNPPMQAQSLGWLNDFDGGGSYDGRVAEPLHDWFLGDWLRACGKKQADVVRDLDWNKSKVSLMVR